MPLFVISSAGNQVNDKLKFVGQSLQKEMSCLETQLSKSAELTPLKPYADISDSIEVGHLQSGAKLPLIIRAKGTRNLIEWAADNRSFLEAQLLNAGAILFRDFGLSTVEEFEHLVENVSGGLLDYSYRSTPRTRISGKIYTSTEYPANQSIPLHNENAYSRNWPMKLWFFSMQVAAQGGETPIADSRLVYQSIPAEIRDCFLRKDLMYVRNYGTGFDLSWRVVFQTESRVEVEDYCKNAGLEFEWLGDDRLRTRQQCQVAEQHPQSGEMVWFNQAHLFHVSRLPAEISEWLLEAFGEEGLPRNVYHADGSPIDPAMLDEISETYERQAVVFPWHEGDVLLLDNMLAAHGRKPFCGARRVVVGMAQASNGS